MKVKDIMTKKVVTVTPSSTFAEIWEIIFKKGIHGLPVTYYSKMVGIIAEEDLLGKLYPSYEDLIEDFAGKSDFSEMENKLGDLTKLTAKDIMNKKIYLTYPERPIMRAMSKMMLKQVRQLPVVEPGEKNKLLGMITKGDIFDALYKKIPGIPGS